MQFIGNHPAIGRKRQNGEGNIRIQIAQCQGNFSIIPDIIDDDGNLRNFRLYRFDRLVNNGLFNIIKDFVRNGLFCFRL